MATLFVRHKVNDFDAWKREYDAFEAERKMSGATHHGVYLTDGIDNEVTVYHEFPNMEMAREFAASEELMAAMERAGVVGEPDIWFGRCVDTGEI